MQNFREYVLRLVEDGPRDEFVAGLKSVGAECPAGDPEDVTRSTARDLSVFPPCPTMMRLVVDVLIASRARSR